MEAIRIHENDNAAVAICNLTKGSSVRVGEDTVVLRDDIPAGHKFALTDISDGSPVIKYAYPIGHAVRDVRSGEHLHTHNVKSDLCGLLDYTYTPDFRELPPNVPETFMGYARKDGSVGIRNEVWILPTVGCVNNTVREIEARAQKFRTAHIDGICAYNHPYGCSQLGEDQNMTLRYLAGLIRHPNAAAVLVVGLGCENGNIGELKKFLGDYDEERVRFLCAQECEDEIAEGTEILRELCDYADTFVRTPCPVSKLTVGMKCGGSDGFSGITANPLLGTFSDRLISMGGSTVLTEVPEMFGAETILMNRCRTEALFEKTVALINNFKRYFMKYGETVDENPSPGNREGGITTLEDKSLGCIQKGGTAPVSDVLSYGESVRTPGLSLLQAPGNDLVASNALAAAGAQIVLFTTGRGTPFGCPVPTVKISSNSALAQKKKNWIDFDAGELLSGTDRSALADAFFRLVLDIASGRASAKSEALDKHELAIFKDGVIL